MTDGMPEGVTEEPYAEDGYTGSRLTFEVTEHTGTPDGTTATWEPQIGEATEISARGEATGSAHGGSSTVLWIVLAVAAVLVIAAVAFFALRKKRTPAVAGPAGQPGQPASYAAPQGQTLT